MKIFKLLKLLLYLSGGLLISVVGYILFIFISGLHEELSEKPFPSTTKCFVSRDNSVKLNTPTREIDELLFEISEYVQQWGVEDKLMRISLRVDNADQTIQRCYLDYKQEDELAPVLVVVCQKNDEVWYLMEANLYDYGNMDLWEGYEDLSPEMVKKIWDDIHEKLEMNNDTETTDYECSVTTKSVLCTLYKVEKEERSVIGDKYYSLVFQNGKYEIQEKKEK